MHLSFLFRLILILILTATSAFANSTAVDRVTVLILGDSLTSGYGLAQEDSFPVQLEKSLVASGYAVRVINAGVSGDTTAGGLARLEWALADKPDIVVVELGANDALRGLNPSQTYANLDQILARLERAGCFVVLAGMKSPKNLGPGYSAEFDQIYPDLANRYDVLFYPFFLDGVATVFELNQADGIHPNPAGVRLIVKGIQPLIIEALERVKNSEARLE